MSSDTAQPGEPEKPPVTTIASFRDLLAYLSEQNVPHAVNTQTQVVEIPTKSPPLEGIVYLRWEKELPYVQVIHPLALNVPAHRVNDIEKALSRANNAIALPGFGFDYERGTLYFRLTLPMFAEGMLASTFQRMILGCVNNARDFFLAFRGIIDGRPGEEVLEAAIAFAQARAEKASLRD
jgi:hypothetical protein